MSERKIYFACSIRGGREDQKFYLEIIQLLKNYGTVLSEHFGDPNLNPNEDMDAVSLQPATEREVHDLDIGWVREANVIVAEVTRPSLGVGYEIGKAEEWRKPVLAIYRVVEGKKLSAMIAGSDKTTISIYDKISDLRMIFDEFFKKNS